MGLCSFPVKPKKMFSQMLMVELPNHISCLRCLKVSAPILFSLKKNKPASYLEVFLGFVSNREEKSWNI